jgi:hypothetical protein
MSTVLLNGQVIANGVKFLWWVTDGRQASITVSNAAYGTQTEVAQRSPEHQAKALAKRMLLAERAARQRRRANPTQRD